MRPAADAARTASAAPAPATPNTAAQAPAAPGAPQAATVDSVVKVNKTVKLHTRGVTRLPWPRVGQASIGVVGMPNFGHSGGNAPVPTASVAKAMTAYVILKDHPLSTKSQGPTLRVTRAEALEFPHQVALQQSLVPVASGEQLTERQALQALMLASADNVAQILARWDAGSVPQFVHKMNATAQALGMTHTHYTDPSGFEWHTRSTAQDQMLLATAALHEPSYKQIASQRTAVIPVAGHIKNFNKLLDDQGVIGIKTGSMNAAGGCLLFAAKYPWGHKNVLVVGTVLGQHSGSMGILDQAFLSSHNLLEGVKRALHPVTIVHKGQVIAHLPNSKKTVVAAKDVRIPGWNGMTLDSTATASVKASAKAGDRVGTLAIGHIGSTPLVVNGR